MMVVQSHVSYTPLAVCLDASRGADTSRGTWVKRASKRYGLWCRSKHYNVPTAATMWHYMPHMPWGQALQ